MKPIIRVENLTKYYQKRCILDIASLEFEKAKIYCLFGPNGAGKTTLLDILDLLEPPTSGKVFFKGQEVNTSSLEARRRMGYVTQDPFLFDKTVFENVFIGLKIRSIKKKEKVKQILEEVGLSNFERRRANWLSGGEAQRVAIARALVYEPEILFLDEPTANIDRKGVQAIEELIKKINKIHQTTIVFTTHNLYQSYRLAEEVISLINGRVTKGSPENLFSYHLIQHGGLKQALLSPSLDISVVSKLCGDAHILIDPKDIILSKEPLYSSARNCLSGQITKIEITGAQVRVEVDTGVKFTALITEQSLKEMGLQVGGKIYAIFKSSSVKVFSDQT